MTNFIEKLNLTTDVKNIPSHAVVFNTREDINVYTTLCRYCADNDLNIKEVSEHDFFATSDLIEEYKKGSVTDGYNTMAFWFDL